MSTVIRYVRQILRIILTVYVAGCVLIVSFWLFLFVGFSISKRFDTVQLPNGSYLSHRRFFSLSRDDIVLRHPTGKVLVNESIDSICFNHDFVEGSTYYGPKPSFSEYTRRTFIYEKGKNEAVFNIDPRYDEVDRRSGLYRSDGCGIEGAWKDFYILLQDPKYRG